MPFSGQLELKLGPKRRRRVLDYWILLARGGASKQEQNPNLTILQTKNA
jgi:hypothetical protein